MGTPDYIRNYNRLTRAGAVRGVEAAGPEGWSVPDPAERLASFSRAMGWDVQAEWLEDNNGRMTLRIELGRLLYPGENVDARGDRWLYRLIWVEVPEHERPSGRGPKMRLEVNRALTPGTAKWEDGPSLKGISDIVGRNPKPVRKPVSVPVVKIKASPDKVG